MRLPPPFPSWPITASLIPSSLAFNNPRLHHHGGLSADLEAAERLPKDGVHGRGHLRPGRRHRQQPGRQHRHRRVHGGLPPHGQEEPAGERAQHVHGHGHRPHQAGHRP